MTSDSLTPARSYLFVPGTRPERFAKALASGADMVVMDLEDAVAADDKATARGAIAKWFETASAEDRSRIVVRINDAGSTWFAADLSASRNAGVASVLLPKAESAEQIAANMLIKSADPYAVSPHFLYEIAKGWLTGSEPDLGEMHHVNEPHRPTA